MKKCASANNLTLSGEGTEGGLPTSRPRTVTKARKRTLGSILTGCRCLLWPPSGFGLITPEGPRTYLGPYPTIASLSLGVSRIFRLREVVSKSEEATRKPRSLDIPLSHNSVRSPLTEQPPNVSRTPSRSFL